MERESEALESVLTSVGVFADHAHGSGLKLFALHWAREFLSFVHGIGVYVQMGVVWYAGPLMRALICWHFRLHQLLSEWR